MLQYYANGIVGALARAAEHQDFAIAGQFVQIVAQMHQINVQRTGHAFHRQFFGVTHIQQETIANLILVGDRHITA